MIIKLQPDQVVLFWDLIKKSMIESNKVPEEYQLDYSINALTKFLSGGLQAWISYSKVDGEKVINAVLATSILDQKYYGVKILNSESIYGFRFISEEIIDEIYDKFEEYAKANGCNVLSADYSINRVKDLLMHMGFEEHRTVCRKFI